MSEKMLSAGDYIASRCSKCKDVTNHTIVAMVENKVVRVECNTCGSVHNYRSVAPTVKPTPRAKTAATKTPRVGKTETEWAAQLNECKASDAISYSIKAAFKPGDVVQHPIFGMGRVINTIRPNKMEVYFRDGIKMLRCTL